MYIGNHGRITQAPECRSLYDKYGNIEKYDASKEYSFVYMETKEQQCHKTRENLNGGVHNIQMTNEAVDYSSNKELYNINGEKVQQKQNHIKDDAVIENTNGMNLTISTQKRMDEEDCSNIEYTKSNGKHRDIQDLKESSIIGGGTFCVRGHTPDAIEGKHGNEDTHFSRENPIEDLKQNQQNLKRTKKMLIRNKNKTSSNNVTNSITKNNKIQPPQVNKKKMKEISTEPTKIKMTPSIGISIIKMLFSKEKKKNDRCNKELKRIWLDKTRIWNRRFKGYNKLIKVRHKFMNEIFKELAEEKKTPAKVKRKLYPPDDNVQPEIKKAKKINTNNHQGTFLAEPNKNSGYKINIDDGHLFKIPQAKVPKQKTPVNTSTSSNRVIMSYEDTINNYQLIVTPMENEIIKSEEVKHRLTKIYSDIAESVANMTSSINKAIHINNPLAFYTESVTKGGGCKKDINMTTNKDRHNLIRLSYPIIDYTDIIISQILNFSNEWWNKRNYHINSENCDTLLGMPTQFNSFEHYKSIILPLMKLDFVSHLEREYNSTVNLVNFNVSLQYVTDNNDRFILLTKLNLGNTSQFNSTLYDLVLLESDKLGPQIFAYRKGADASCTIIYEIITKNITKDYLFTIEQFKVRPVMSNVHIYLNAFNAVYQLEATPLFHKILNPLELLKYKSASPPKTKVIYRGYNQLNDRQKVVLLNTYKKIIDETTSNITLLECPHGTGKSGLIVNLALQTLYGDEVLMLDKKILICAPSNASIDVIAAKFVEIMLKMRAEIRFRLIRYGARDNMHPKVLPVALGRLVEHDYWRQMNGKNEENTENLKNQILQLESQIAHMQLRKSKSNVEELRLLEKQQQIKQLRGILNTNMRPEYEHNLKTYYLSNANIVCATLTNCAEILSYINYFDICIIDKANRCNEPSTLLPLKFGINSLVLVADSQQLPANVLSKKARELGLGTSLYQRIQNCLDNVPSTSRGNATTPDNIIYSL